MIGNILQRFLLAILLIALSTPAQGKEEKALSVEQAVATALQNNRNLQIKKAERDVAAGALLITRGDFDTFVHARLVKAKQEIPAAINDPIQSEKTTSWGVGAEKKFSTGTAVKIDWDNNRFQKELADLPTDPVSRSGLNITLRQPILKGFGKKNQLANQHRAEKTLQATVDTMEHVAATLVADVKKAYWYLVFTRENLKARQLSLQLAEQLLEETKEQIESGHRAPVDIYQPEAEIALRKKELIADEKAIAEAEDNLKLLMGITNDSDWQQNYQPVDSPPTAIAVFDSENIFENALASRADFHAAKKQLEAAEYTLSQREDQLRPSLDLVGGYTFSGSSKDYQDSVKKNLEDPEQSWNAGIEFALPLGNDSARGALEQARAQRNKARIQLELIRQQIHAEVRTVLRDIGLARKTMTAAGKTVTARDKQLKAEQARFAVGRATTFDLLSAQQSYASALSQMALSEMNYAISIAEIERVQGYSLEKERAKEQDTPHHSEKKEK